MTLTLVGRVVKTQGAGVDEAEVRAFVDGTQQTLTVAGEEAPVAHTHPDGSYVASVSLPEGLFETGTIAVEVTKPSFGTTRQELARSCVLLAVECRYREVVERFACPTYGTT